MQIKTNLSRLEIAISMATVATFFVIRNLLESHNPVMSKLMMVYEFVGLYVFLFLTDISGNAKKPIFRFSRDAPDYKIIFAGAILVFWWPVFFLIKAGRKK